jgi:hypothetical protein
LNKVAILQSNYLPWRGYFDLIRQADVFVFLDSVQYTRRDWRNRNKIITPAGLHWLSVPVHGSRGLCVNQVQIDNSIPWQKKHYHTLCQYYKRSDCFTELHPWLREVYLGSRWTMLSELNKYLICWISDYLGIQTQFVPDTQFVVTPDKNQRLADIVQELGGTVYLTGPSALAYLDIELFHSRGIGVEVMHYSQYPTYQQFWGITEPKVSIIDLLLHKGKDSLPYIAGTTI